MLIARFIHFRGGTFIVVNVKCCYFRVYMVCSNMVTLITVHYASCSVLFRNLKYKMSANRCYCCFQWGKWNYHLLRKELFIPDSVRFLRERSSIYVFVCFLAFCVLGRDVGLDCTNFWSFTFFLLSSRTFGNGCSAWMFYLFGLE